MIESDVQGRATSESSFLVWLVLLCSLAAEGSALYALTEKSLLGFLGLHLVAVVLAAESLRLSARQSQFSGEVALASAGAFLTAAFPGIGSFVVVYFVVARPRGKRSFTGMESLEEQRARAALEAIERKRAVQQVGGQVHSIADALKNRDKEVRIAAVESLRGEVSQKAVQLLAASQVNTVFDVRVRAIENLNLLRDQFRKKLAESRHRVQQQENSLDAILDHAKLCLENAELGIEDQETADTLFQEAHWHASQVSAIWPGREVRMISASALRALGRHREAEFEYLELLKQDRDDIEAVMGLAEMQFLRRDFDTLRSTCRLIVRMKAGELEAELAPVLRFWLQPHRSPQGL